jgi:DNA polymerase-3 subunit gamma/tau
VQALEAQQPASQLETTTKPQAYVRPLLVTFEDVLALADEMREGKLRTHLISDVRVVHFEQGRIEFSPGPQAPRDLAQSLSAFLKKHSDHRWMVSVSAEQGCDTISEQRVSVLEDLRAKVSEEPLVKAVLKMFPGATLDEVIREDVLTLEAVTLSDDDNFDD